MSKNVPLDLSRLILISIVLFIGSFFLFEKSTNMYVIAQSKDKVSLEFSESQFFPYTEDRNLLEILVDYKTNDLSLVDSTINGVMQVFAPDGTLLKTTSYPNGFTITDFGIIGFRTSFMDDSLNSVTTNITLTDLEKTEVISNTVQTTVPFNDDEDLELLITPQGLSSAISNNANLDNSNNEEIERLESPSQADLNVTSSTAYFEGDNFYIVGEVANTGEENKEFVKVIATVYDENDNVIGNEFTYTQPSTILSSESSSFKLLISSDDASNLNDIKSYKVVASVD